MLSSWKHDDLIKFNGKRDNTNCFGFENFVFKSEMHGWIGRGKNSRFICDIQILKSKAFKFTI